MGTTSVLGSGPNGLAAAVVLASCGLQTTLYEAADTVGGALRSSDPLGPGTVTDHGAAVLPFTAASPLLTRLPLEQHGLRLLHPPVPLAHPLEGRPAALLHRHLDETTTALGRDTRAWRALHAGPVRHGEQLVDGALGPLLRSPAHSLVMAGFGARGAWPASVLARAPSVSRRRGRRSRGLPRTLCCRCPAEAFGVCVVQVSRSWLL